MGVYIGVGGIRNGGSESQLADDARGLPLSHGKRRQGTGGRSGIERGQPQPAAADRRADSRPAEDGGGGAILRRHHRADRLGAGSVAGRCSEPDEESSETLRRKGARERKAERSGSDVRRAVGTDLFAPEIEKTRQGSDEEQKQGESCGTRSGMRDEGESRSGPGQGRARWRDLLLLLRGLRAALSKEPGKVHSRGRHRQKHSSSHGESFANAETRRHLAFGLWCSAARKRPRMRNDGGFGKPGG